MLTITAPAKINLALNVLFKRPDGYHEIDSVMQAIGLADQILLCEQDLIELTCSEPRLPIDQRNLAWRAAELLQAETGITRGVKIHITKKIPIAAGLAGGSTDAAGVLIGLNQLWNLGLSNIELMKIGVKLGADVPFCIHKGVARAQGIGEKLFPIKSSLNCTLLLVTPNIPVSTADAYARLQLDQLKNRPQVDEVAKALEKGDFNQLVSNWGNVFETGIIADFPAVSQAKALFQKFGLAANLMSGSGPSVYALNPDPKIIDAFSKAIPPDWFWSFTQFL